MFQKHHDETLKMFLIQKMTFSEIIIIDSEMLLVHKILPAIRRLFKDTNSKLFYY